MTDLTPTSLTASTQATVGESIDFSASIMNAGFTTTDTFQAAIYLSEDDMVAPDDTFLDSCEFNGLANAVSVVCAGPLTIPVDLNPGTYYLGVVVDNLGAVLESDDTNNSRAADSGTILLLGAACGPNLTIANHTLTGTQTLEATATAILGPDLIVNGDNIVVKAPTVTIMGGTTISGTFSVGNSPSCP